jgi:putative addiction module killer protein
MEAIETKVYQTNTGKRPFLEWLNKLDIATQSIVKTRIARIRKSNIGNHKKIKGADIWELRVDYGPGFRIYFGKQGSTVVVLLMGGTKGSQSRDITKAQQYWLEYRSNKNG